MTIGGILFAIVAFLAWGGWGFSYPALFVIIAVLVAFALFMAGRETVQDRKDKRRK